MRNVTKSTCPSCSKNVLRQEVPALTPGPSHVQNKGSHLFGSQHEGQIHPRFDDKVTEISDVRDPHIKTSDLHFSENLPDIDNSEPQVTSNLGSKNSVEPLFVSKANDNRPYLSVCIDNENITALLDSGSNANILGKLNLNIDYNTALQLTTADGQIQNTLGFVYLPITFNGEDCKIKVLVVPSISHQLILGIDFILQFKLNINFGNFSYQSCAMPKQQFAKVPKESGITIGEKICGYTLDSDKIANFRNFATGAEQEAEKYDRLYDDDEDTLCVA
nr:unnamed protein product [Callosobruchus chinensis]